MNDNLIEQIQKTQTTADLDKLRIPIVQAINKGEDFESLQKAFQKQKNKLRRYGR